LLSHAATTQIYCKFVATLTCKVRGSEYGWEISTRQSTTSQGQKLVIGNVELASVKIQQARRLWPAKLEVCIPAEFPRCEQLEAVDCRRSHAVLTTAILKHAHALYPALPESLLGCCDSASLLLLLLQAEEWCIVMAGLDFLLSAAVAARCLIMLKVHTADCAASSGEQVGGWPTPVEQGAPIEQECAVTCCC
jgi:hypothetical protein